ncbi:MAG TPA: hypothetical protein VNK43_03745 [Gemmatimonadales bacterium]|nr:hypothetical protein [Gemmatimonadales bacterium]
MTSWSRKGLLTAFALAACSRSDGQSPGDSVDRPDAVLPGAFTQVGNVVELRDGRIAFTDLSQKVFLVGDFARGTVDTLGERVDSLGAGDSARAAYEFPGHVVHLAGDTLALVDFAGERTTLWSEAGRYLGVVRLGHVAGRNLPLAYDAAGRAYKADYRGVMGGLEPGQRVDFDSVPVVRLTRGAATADTVARLKLPPLGPGRFGEQIRDVPMIFGGSDLFGVLPDGSLWIARAATNSVDWLAPDGRWIRGTARPYQKVPVTQTDKDRFMAAAYRSGLPRNLAIEYPFAEFKPPFSSALGRENGEVWLQRSRAADDPVAVYDVFGRDAAWLRTVTFPRHATVAGLGRRHAYAVLKEGETQKVARFALE